MADRPDVLSFPSNRRFRDVYGGYQRGDLIRHLPFSMTIVGSRHTGKSEFMQDVMGGEIPPLRFDFDDYTYYSDERPRNRQIVNTPYANLNKPRGMPGRHSLVVFDDPPMENREFRHVLNDIMRTGRHEGMSVMVALHSASDLGVTQNKYLRNNSDLIVLPSQFVNRNINAIRQHNLYPFNINDLDRSEGFNYNVIDDRQHLSIIQR